MKSKVSIVKCQDYDQPRVDEAVQKSLDLIGSLQNIIKPGNTVLIKVNALMSAPPDKACTTHPSLVIAVSKAAIKLGAKVIIGDSPGSPTANIKKLMEETGFSAAAEKTGAQIVNFAQSGAKSVPSPSDNKRINSIHISKAVLDADIVINIAKLKTHNLTLFTGAIKNMFGSVPSFDKSKYHFKAHRPHHFAESIVDIYEITKPQLNIVDAVYGMEGKGPANGEKRYMGAILSSFDGVALDAVCASAIGYKPFQIDTTRVAHKRGLGKGKLEEIEIIGTPLSEITKRDWKLTGNGYYITKYIPDFIFSLLKPIINQLRIDPEIIQEKCTKCLVCVKACPTHTIDYSNNKVKIDLKNCIMCYCCHELCEYNAIKLKRRWLVKLIGIGTDE